MSSKVDICNLALTYLGEPVILSLDDDLPGAKYCKANFDLTRDAVTRAHFWNCATAQADLAQLSDTPAYGYLYLYQLPTDCLWVQEVYGVGSTGWKVRGKTLACDLEEVSITYSKRLTDPEEIEPLMADALASRLAAVLAKPLTGDLKVWQAMWKQYGLILTEATRRDTLEGSQETGESFNWLDAR